MVVLKETEKVDEMVDCLGFELVA
jgi:hypothetical protein